MAQQIGKLKLTLAAAAGNAGVLNQANPDGVDLIVTAVTLYPLTDSTSGAVTLDVGIGSAGASNDNLLDGINPAALTPANTPGTNGAVPRRWAANQSLTATASADPAGLTGYLIVEYTPVGA